ncbi:uncharacterized protein [Salminus brasiliensis]|uniref:uncharacterized protein n=1 Tax=Salminus brasiliensis TaxID=930266 RepID=UPI003B836F6D
MSSKVVYYFTVVTGQTLQVHNTIKKHLHQKIQFLRQAFIEEEADVILLFCPVVSWAESDVKAALQMISCISEIKTVFLIVLHHTINPDCSVPDSSIFVTRQNTTILDFLFNEDKGLLTCHVNENALLKITDWLEFKGKESPEEEIKRLKQGLTRLKRELTNKDKQLKEKDELIPYINRLENNLQDVNTKLEKITTLQEDHNAKHAKDEKLLEDIAQELKARRQISKFPARRTHSMEGLPPFISGEFLAPELRLVLLGKTGCGRSAAANTIMGREEKSQAEASVVRQQSKSRQVKVAGRKVTIVDTTDWFKSELSLEELRQDVGLCVHLSAPGPHAFLLVIPVKQSTGKERGMLEKMEEIFGERCWRNTMILFTVTDEVQKQTLEELVQSGDQEVQRLVEKCGNRFHCLNIKNSEDGSQVSELLEKIEKMVKGNRQKFYSSDIYLETDSQIKAMERKIKMEREEEKLQKEKELKKKQNSELQNSLRKIEGAIQEHEGNIRQLNGRIAKLERQMTEEEDEEERRKAERELTADVEQKTEMEEKIRRLIESRDRERIEMEERHRQEVEEIRETYEGEARMKAERKLMRIILSELQRNILASKSKMQEGFCKQIEEKDRELEMLKQRLSELTQAESPLTEVSQTSESEGTVGERHRGMFRLFHWLFRR